MSFHSVRLSKSSFKDGKKCAKRLWLRLNQPELMVRDEAMEARAAIGQQVGLMGRGLNPGGIEIEGRTTRDRLVETERLLREGHGVLYEAAFEEGGLYAQFDILYRVGEGWGIREVKAAKSINDGHVVDAVFQYLVLTRAGLKIDRVELVLIAQDAPSIEKSRVEDLLVVQDLTDICRRDAEDLVPEIMALLTTLSSGEAEQIEAGRHCEATCPFLSHCFSGLSDDDLLFAPNLDKRKYAALREAGYRRMSELPAEMELSLRAEGVRRAIASGREPWVSEKLGAALAEVRYPAVFLDFETASPLFPVNNGMRGGELVVFQFSAHVLSEPSGAMAHYQFIDLDSEDPHPAIVAALTDVFKGAGSIMHYSPFEKRCLNRLMAAGVPGANALMGQFLKSSVDLEKFFGELVYHPKFRGKSSIKVVLPVMVPGLSYDDLEVKSGGMAEMSYVLARTGELFGDDLARRREALLKYCERDTWAMVKLFERLLELR
ncbi:MAG: DUF2779 domain-containing protein [Fimbriimonadaceae bacterium]